MRMRFMHSSAPALPKHFSGAGASMPRRGHPDRCNANIAPIKMPAMHGIANQASLGMLADIANRRPPFAFEAFTVRETDRFSLRDGCQREQRQRGDQRRKHALFHISNSFYGL
ncbi:hypothetical protein [Burkholderia ambifaria]|uniref:hypothetical protein n=1 Tax=Burkholderia ambifaria TaxID=152480 RepID=UPI002FE33C60